MYPFERRAAPGAASGAKYEPSGLTPISTPPILGASDPKVETNRKQRVKEINAPITRNAGPVLQTISSDSILPVAADITWNRDPELLCSYNWQDYTDGTSIILVPGAPPRWTPPTLPYTLALDSGIQYTDHNYARRPEFPYSPMFRALAIMNPNVQFLDVDVVADRNNLRTLLEFVQGKSKRSFRLNLHLVDNTLFLVRHEDRYWSRSDGAGYGHNFENHFTRAEQGMQGASSHYRVIRYPLGPLNLVMRFEADAYLASPESFTNIDPSLEGAPFIPRSGGAAERPHPSHSAYIHAIPMGVHIPCSTIVELKTTAPRKNGKIKKMLPMDQIWFGRTPHLFTGVCGKGTGIFHRVKYSAAKERAASWEERNQDSLRKLVALLTLLKEVLKKGMGPARACVLVREEKDGPLKLREMKVKSHIVTLETFGKHWQRTPAPRPFQLQWIGHFQPRDRGQGQTRGDGQLSPQNDAEFHPRANGQGQKRRRGYSHPRGNGQFLLEGNGQSPSRSRDQFHQRGRGQEHFD